jgi:hypothetical protein
MRILFLDDDTTRVAEFEIRTGLKVTHVLTRQEFIDAITCQYFDVIMLDHDLGWRMDNDKWNGSEAAKFLAENPSLLQPDQTIIIHSTNSIGVANMLSQIKYTAHLRVNVIHWAWANVSYRDGKLFFTL